MIRRAIIVVAVIFAILLSFSGGMYASTPSAGPFILHG
jgi:hypothetical protein